MSKNYGSGVSGYLDPEGRSWNIVVHQAGKPLLDKELNLAEDLKVQKIHQSGWHIDDWSVVENAPYWQSSSVANQIAFKSLRAFVNGWDIVVDQTHSVSDNVLDMGPGPANGLRTDLVILEVWLRLISPAPSTDGKSPSGRIWKNGNVKLFDPLNPNLDLTNNYVDDILDANVGSETTRRVQVQYRLRVVHNVDLLAYPDGLSDPTVFANSVPASATAPDGSATTYNYSIVTYKDDVLWRAGDGNPSNALGTVDGYMYALPLSAVFRRNTSAFDRNTNHNGGVASPGPSDRPDGLFHDIFVRDDIADLVVSTGSPQGVWSPHELLDRNMHFLLDNELRTEWMTTVNGGGVRGHTVLWADEIGITNANGGDGTTTGDTPGAEFIGQFDAVRREFSDRAVIEKMVVTITCPGASWSNGDTVTITPSALAIYPYTTFNWAAYAPNDVTFVDVAGATFFGTDSSHVTTEADIATIDGLGTIPQGNLTVTLGTVPAGVTNEDLHVEILVSYPSGLGLTKTPTEWFGSASLEYNNAAQLPATAPVYFDTAVFSIDAPHREASLRYQTKDISLTISGAAVASSVVYLPERAHSVSHVDVNGGAAEPFTLAADGRSLTLTANTAGPGDVVNVTMVAMRPFPQNNEQVTIWYHARAPQTIRDLNLPVSFTGRLLEAASSLQVLTTGSGSMDEAYPYPMAYTQLGGVNTPSGVSFSGDHELDAGAKITVSNFDAQTGWLELPVFLPVAVGSGDVTFNRPGGAGEVDAEGRTYYSNVMSGSYLLNAYAQQLSSEKKHKVVLPMLVRLDSSTGFAHPGQSVLVLLTRWASFDPDNGVWFDSAASTNATSASIYRLKGGPIGRRNS